MIEVPPSPASTTTPDTAESIWGIKGEKKYWLRAVARQLARVQTENRLCRDVHAGSVECLKEHLCGVFAVLLRVKGNDDTHRCVVERLGDQKVVLLRVAAELLIQRVVEDLLHAVPVLNNSVLDRTRWNVIVVTKRVLSDEVIQVLNAFIQSVVPLLSLTHLLHAYVGTVRNSSWKDGGRNGIPSVSDFCVSAR